MIFKNTDTAYGLPAKGLHWLSALIVLCLLPLGFYMVSLEFSPFKIDLYWWHKSFGTLVFFLVLARLVWRTLNRQPAHLEGHAAWERTLACIVHVLLYTGMIGMPLSGFLMSGAADFAQPFFGLFMMPDLIDGRDEDLFRLMREVHEICGYALLAGVGLHGIGAFKHHFVDKDITLVRMLPVFKPMLGAVLVLVVFVTATGAAALLAARHILHEEPAAVEQPTADVITASVPDQPVPGADGMTSWAIIHDQSRIGFIAVAQGEEFEGQFKEFEGTILFDPENLAQSRVDIRVKTGSVVTGSDERDDYIGAPAWLHTESFPESQFVADRFEKTGENQYIAHGTLTIRGIMQAVDVPFTLVFSEDKQGQQVALMEGSFALNRLDYDVGGGAWAEGDTVANTLHVKVSLQAVAE